MPLYQFKQDTEEMYVGPTVWPDSFQLVKLSSYIEYCWKYVEAVIVALLVERLVISYSKKNVRLVSSKIYDIGLGNELTTENMEKHSHN